MANLSFIDKQLIEEVLGMSGGYVLDFSNRTFDEFMTEVIGESIYTKYPYMSKANLLRNFIADYSDAYVGKMIVLAIKYMRSRNLVTPTNEVKVNELLSFGQSKLGRTPKTKNSEHPTPKPSEKGQINYQVLVNDLLKLDAISDAQKRGYEFEKYLNKLFGVFGLDPHASYRTETDQIDGSFILNGNTILLEAKYRAAQLSKNDLILFENKVSRKSQFARGLFVSLSDFDENVVNYFKDRSSRIIALSVPEIYMMCSQEQDLRDVLTRKFQYLDEYGIIYRHINLLF